MSGIRTFIRFLFSCISFLLLLAFVIHIFAFNREQSTAVVQLIQPVLPTLSRIVEFLQLPVNHLLALLQPFIPAGFHAWFPVTPAWIVIKKLSAILLLIPPFKVSTWGQAISNAHFQAIFPGVMDWRFLFSLCIWGFVESLIWGMLIRIEGLQYRSMIRKRDGWQQHAAPLFSSHPPNPELEGK